MCLCFDLPSSVHTPLPIPMPPNLMASLNSNIQAQNWEDLSDLLSSPHAQVDTRSHPVHSPNLFPIQFLTAFPSNFPVQTTEISLLLGVFSGLPLQALLTWHPTTLPWRVAHPILYSKYMHLSEAVWEAHNLAPLLPSNHFSSYSHKRYGPIRLPTAP